MIKINLLKPKIVLSIQQDDNIWPDQIDYEKLMKHYKKTRTLNKSDPNYIEFYVSYINKPIKIGGR